ncbi:thermonuclease family protein [Candidatus Saccharibacteria bacterium]|nr:thermonuclease family protein [Candidatus Saccharibacteria bacterium]
MSRQRVSKRHLLIVVFVALGSLALLALKFGWVKPIDTKTFMHYQPGSYQVKQFLDGDTVTVDMSGTVETIRFIGIDTPETHKPNTPVQCYGPAAAAYTKNRIGSQRIKLVSDSLTTNRDRYDRLLRYVILEDGTNLNLELVQKGYAFAYAFPFAKSNDFNAAMEQAQAAKAGLWGNCAPYQDPKNGQWHTPSAD